MHLIPSKSLDEFSYPVTLPCNVKMIIKVFYTNIVTFKTAPFLFIIPITKLVQGNY